MFKEFFQFEINYRFKRPMLYVFSLICFLLVFAATASENIRIGGSHDAIHVNSPYVIMSIILIMTVIGIFMTTAFMNTAILRDFNYKFDGILFSTPINKASYLGGRFLGAFLASLVPFIFMLVAIEIGALTPWVNAKQVGAFMPQAHLITFFVAVVPNVFLVSSIVFLFGSLFRSSLVSFIGAIAILVLYIMMLSFTSDIDNEVMATLLDPLGVSAFDYITRYWTIDEQNNNWMMLTTPFLINRFIWIAVGFIALGITYTRFSFAPKKSIFSRKNKTLKTVTNDLTSSIGKLKALPKVTTNEGFATAMSQFFHQTKMEFWGIAKSTPFIVLLVFGLINMLTALPNVDNMFGTGNHPVTYLVVDGIRGTLYLFLVAIFMFYSGQIIWREREAKMNEFFDASPFPTWIPFSSKFVALVGITALILVFSILTGIGFQAFSGYTNFEIGVYFREFLVYDLFRFSCLIILSMLIQVLINNKYLGFFVFILLLIGLTYIPGALELQSNLLSYGSIPNYTYSDMNAWGPFAKGVAFFQTYWLLFASLLGVVSILFWVRGKSLTWKERFRIAGNRFSGKFVGITALLGVLWLGTAAFMTYQTTMLNKIETPDSREKAQIAYEEKYKQYEHIPQPRITDVHYDIDIFPYERNYLANAKIKAKNKTQESIDKIHFTVPDNLDIEINIEGASIELQDDISNYRIYQLANPLGAGEELNFDVKVSYTSKGIENEVENTSIVSNGTFINKSTLMPVIGYTESFELSDKEDRADNSLPAKARAQKLHANCSASCGNSYISNDSDWVNVSTTISTANDQIAIAPGSLVKEWEENGRRYFDYKLKKPVLNFYSFISGRYETAKEVWTSPEGQKVNLEVYYHKGHEYNVDKMLASLRHSLEYNSKHFLPYPHEEARIIEFPRYASFAQAFPGTMPYSESIGFIANLNEEDAIDMVYYVVAHEVAHQWWAHQVIGADVQGSVMLSETFSQYAALMVMKEKYGDDKMKQFLRYEMDRYLRGRTREQEKELPLMYNENQSYIYYQKGSVVMYALQDFIGEETLNQALKNYAEAVAYQEPPYTTSLQFMNYLEEIVPDSLQYLVNDMFKDIILYSNKTNNGTYKALDNGQYEVTIDVSVEKFKADTLGRETLIPHNDYIDIGVYSEERNEGERYGRPIKVERHKIAAKDTSFTLIVDELPHEAGIDPNYLLVDRFPEDNVKTLDLVY